jgi:hypothetical protein
VNIDVANIGDRVEMTFEVWCMDRRDAEGIYAAGWIAQGMIRRGDAMGRAKADRAAREEWASSRTMSCFYPLHGRDTYYVLAAREVSKDTVTYALKYVNGPESNQADGSVWWKIDQR